MTKPGYRIPPRRERELSKQVRDLQARLDSLSRDPSATLEISRLEGIVAERDAAIAGLESELESERAKTARLRGELESSRAKREELESRARQLKCDVGNERARTRSAQSNYERMAAGHARLLDENRSLKERNSELEAELVRKDALIEHLNARLSRGRQSYVYVFHGGDAAVFRASDAKGHAGVKGSPLEDAPDATVVSDHDTTYHSYGKRHAECNCHILRYLKGVAQNEPGQAWAEDMAALLKLANDTAKKARASGLEGVDPEVVAKFESCCKAIPESALEGYMASGAASWKHPPEGIKLARRMLKHAKKHLLFLSDLSVPFENNGSERLLRQAKKKVKQSGGFRSTPNGEQPQDQEAFINLYYPQSTIEDLFG